MVTGIFAAVRPIDGPNKAFRSPAAKAIPSTRCATIESTIWIWRLKSVSLAGPVPQNIDVQFAARIERALLYRKPEHVRCRLRNNGDLPLLTPKSGRPLASIPHKSDQQCPSTGHTTTIDKNIRPGNKGLPRRSRDRPRVFQYPGRCPIVQQGSSPGTADSLRGSVSVRRSSRSQTDLG